MQTTIHSSPAISCRISPLTSWVFDSYGAVLRLGFQGMERRQQATTGQKSKPIQVKVAKPVGEGWGRSTWLPYTCWAQKVVKPCSLNKATGVITSQEQTRVSKITRVINLPKWMLSNQTPCLIWRASNLIRVWHHVHHPGNKALTKS